MGVMSSVALLCYFFYLLVKEGPCSGCAKFVAANRSNAISRPGKKVEDFRNKWLLMDASHSYPGLVLLTGMPAPHKGWNHEKLADPRVEQLMEKGDPILEEAYSTKPFAYPPSLAPRMAGCSR